MIKLFKIILLSMLLMVLSSCSVHHVTKPPSINPELISSVQANQELTIINSQASTEDIKIGTVGVGTLYGSLNKWTDSAVDLLKTELTKKGVKISDNSPKVLKLAITHATIKGVPIIGGANCKVYLTVETSNNYKNEFVGKKYSLAPPSSCDSAVTEVIEIMLRDDKILSYLKE